jgi:hypothetical protein
MRCFVTGLPDGIFANQKSQFGHNLEGLEMEICCYIFLAIWTILWPFGIGYGHFVILWSFGIVYPFWYTYCTREKNLTTLLCNKITE